ncbi:MAG: FAD-dependent oxidoreductase [Candidatus Gracilibacteria bacterium]
MSENTSVIYDFLIIGAGCAGASGGMYGARLNLKTAMIGELPGGLITTTHLVENWPGIKQISGPDLAAALLDHAASYNVPLINEKVLSVGRAVQNVPAGKQSGFLVKTGSNSYLAKTVLFATGTEHKKLGVPGEKELANKGVSYCALCDAGFFRNKVVAVVGSGDSAVKEAILLAEQCAKVYLLIRGDVVKAEGPNQTRLQNNPKIEVRFKAEIAEIKGSTKVEKVLLKSGEELPMQGVFVAVGHLPLSGLAKELGVALNNHGEIMVNRQSQTNLPGIFAAGDVTDSSFKQAITGASEAVVASYFAYDYVSKSEVVFE